MSTAEIKELRRETKKYLDHADERVLKMIYAMLQGDASNDDHSLTPEQEAILDKRMELEKHGLIEYSSWDEVKARIVSKKWSVILRLLQQQSP